MMALINFNLKLIVHLNYKFSIQETINLFVVIIENKFFIKDVFINFIDSIEFINFINKFVK